MKKYSSNIIHSKSVHKLLVFSKHLFMLGILLLLFSCANGNETKRIDLIPTPLFETQHHFLVVVDEYVRAYEIKEKTSSVIKVFRRGKILRLLEQGEKVETKTWYAINDSGRVLWISAREVLLSVLEAEALLFSKRLY